MGSAFGTPQQVALRCRIVLVAASGQSDQATAEQLATNRHTVRLWRQRFPQQGLQGLWEIAPGRGRKANYSPEKIQAIIDTTLQSKPKGRTPWSCRCLAERMGVSKSTVNNIWRSHNLKPHRVKTFKLSRDPHFLEKLSDVLGLYLNPPEQAMVLCGRKEPNSSSGSHPTRLADAEGALRHPDPRLQTQRHHHAVCRPGTGPGQGGGTVLSAAPPSGIPEIPPPFSLFDARNPSSVVGRCDSSRLMCSRSPDKKSQSKH